MGNRFYSFMLGRYGMDNLGYVIIIASMIVTLLSSIFSLHELTLISYALLAWEIFRFLSKNKYKRSAENYKFLRLFTSIKKKFTLSKNKVRDRKTHRYFECTTCHNTLRVPKGKGEIKVTCPVCKTVTITKS